MGCGTSTCIRVDDQLPAGPRPEFRSPVEEMKRRNESMTERGYNISTKEPLANSDDGSPDDAWKGKGASLSLERGMMDGKVAPEPHGDDEPEEEAVKGLKIVPERVILETIKEEWSNSEDEMEEDEGVVEGERGREEKGNGKLVGPGSPSFREYCMDNGKEEKRNNESESPEMLNFDQGSITELEKKAKKGKGFRRAVTDLLHI